MILYGDPNAVYGVGTYGGRDAIQWCNIMSSSFEDEECQQDFPARPCTEDED